jgi:hypothetical protein
MLFCSRILLISICVWKVGKSMVLCFSGGCAQGGQNSASTDGQLSVVTTGGSALPDASFGVVDLLQFLPRARWFVWREVVFSVLMTRGGEFCRCAETAT